MGEHTTIRWRRNVCHTENAVDQGTGEQSHQWRSSGTDWWARNWSCFCWFFRQDDTGTLEELAESRRHHQENLVPLQSSHIRLASGGCWYKRLYRPAHVRAQERLNHTDICEHGRRKQTRERQPYYVETKDNSSIESRRAIMTYKSIGHILYNVFVRGGALLLPFFLSLLHLLSMFNSLIIGSFFILDRTNSKLM